MRLDVLRLILKLDKKNPLCYTMNIKEMIKMTINKQEILKTTFSFVMTKEEEQKIWDVVELLEDLQEDSDVMKVFDHWVDNSGSFVVRQIIEFLGDLARSNREEFTI